MIRIKSLSIAITATALAAASAGAQNYSPPSNSGGARYDDSDQEYREYYGKDYDYVKTDTYAGNNCKRFSGATGESEYGSYRNNNNDASWVHCPIVSHNNPYQAYVYVDAQVYDPSNDWDIECNLRKRTPNGNGWSLYQGESRSTSGRSSQTRRLSLDPVPGGFTPSSHVYMQCVVPGYDQDYSEIGNYSAY